MERRTFAMGLAAAAAGLALPRARARQQAEVKVDPRRQPAPGGRAAGSDAQ
jgi:hypothetical protein